MDAQTGLHLCCLHATKLACLVRGSRYTCISAFPVLEVGYVIVCSHAVIRGIDHHNGTGLVRVWNKSLLHPSSKAVAVCLTVPEGGAALYVRRAPGMKPCLLPACTLMILGHNSSE